jgi:UDP-glucose 4-epimerase
VSLLAKAYAAFVGASPKPGTMRRLNPSGYPESQGAPAERVRRETDSRLARPCRLELGVQTEFPEPPVRINTDVLDAAALEWSEAQSWDQFVQFYDRAVPARA